MYSRLVATTLALIVCCSTVLAQGQSKPADSPVTGTPKPMPAAEPPKSDKMAFSGLSPSHVVPNLCLVHYPITTTSKECQEHFDQGLGYFYSYVWMEAARSFETAAKCDPDCAMAWWGLSRALEKWSKPNANQALEKAQQLLTKASHREQFLINARLQEKGMIAGVTPDKRLSTASKTLDELLTLYDDDEEGWYYKAQVVTEGTAKVVFYKALLRVNPLHPGANHELVHFYENYKRPALGWPHAEKYVESSPGIPHAFHMQAHLAMRIGKWQKTTDWSARAVELERAYHKDFNVKPSEDHQYNHHVETLLRSLIHDGRFKEAREIKKEADRLNYNFNQHWFRMYLAERDFEAAMKLAEDTRKKDKLTGSYYAALTYLKQGDACGATCEVEVLQEAFKTKKSDRQLETRLWETQGLLMCLTDGGDAGLKLLQKNVEKTKNDYGHHAWAGGAYYMEGWGVGGLAAGRWDAAEEGFLEALAHEPGCVRAALGLQAMCEKLGRTEEAGRYAELARRCWAKADSGRMEAELEAMRHLCNMRDAASVNKGEQ